MGIHGITLIPLNPLVTEHHRVQQLSPTIRAINHVGGCVLNSSLNVVLRCWDKLRGLRCRSSRKGNGVFECR